MMKKIYIDNGVYVAFDVEAAEITLTTEVGRRKHTIVLEAKVLDALTLLIEQFRVEVIEARQRLTPEGERAFDA